MSWAARRRFLILIILLVLSGALAFWRYAPVIFRAPSCTDGQQNGTELGVDCGGSMCSNLCAFEVSSPVILWARSFVVAGSVHNAVAYVENKNDAAARGVPYEFRLYDANGILIARQGGTATIPPLGRYAIVETGIDSGTGTVARTTFQFASNPVTWYRVPADQKNARLLMSGSALDQSGTVPRLTANLENTSPRLSLENTLVSAILYDENDNAINASRTVIPALGPRQSAGVAFTWPAKLSAPVVRYEILPLIDVFRAR